MDREQLETICKSMPTETVETHCTVYVVQKRSIQCSVFLMVCDGMKDKSAVMHKLSSLFPH